MKEEIQIKSRKSEEKENKGKRKKKKKNSKIKKNIEKATLLNELQENNNLEVPEDFFGDVPETENEEFKGKDYPESVEIKGINYIREDIKENPQEITEKFLNRKLSFKWWNVLTWDLFNKPRIFKPRGNLLFLLDNENNIKIYENVKSGVFRIKLNEGTDNEKENFLILKPNKLRALRFFDWDGQQGVLNEDFWRCWVHDINSPTSYPHEPMYDTEQVGEAIRKAVTDRRTFDEGKKKGFGGNWLFWIMIALIVSYAVYLIGVKYGGFAKLQGMFPKEAVAVTTTTLKNMVTNVPGGTLSG